MTKSENRASMSVMGIDHDPTQQHDFNWVKARRECSLSCEMQKLRDAVQASVKERREDAETDLSADVVFTKDSETHFSVCHRVFPRYSPNDYDWCVHFTLESDKIKVTQTNRQGPVNSFGVTLTLNDKDKCLYQIDEKGEYLRWQVVRQALAQLYFPSHP